MIVDVGYAHQPSSSSHESGLLFFLNIGVSHPSVCYWICQQNRVSHHMPSGMEVIQSARLMPSSGNQYWAKRKEMWAFFLGDDSMTNPGVPYDSAAHILAESDQRRSYYSAMP
uniref:Uncharacterized protein n=1 Tax=Opuntia streptacantha TaxID=393608 RepID=A0A7C9EXC2_OPUST